MGASGDATEGLSDAENRLGGLLFGLLCGLFVSGLLSGLRAPAILPLAQSR